MSILHGDCLASLPKIDDQSIQLVYLDPPFFTQKSHSLRTRDNTVEYRFEDRWDSLEGYLSFIREVLIQCKRLLKYNGSIFLHCDKSASHHLRILLDEIFGINNFQSEIIWAYKRWSNSKKGLLNAHQTIYFYSRTEDFKFNPIYTEYSPTTNIDQILQARVRNDSGKSVYQRDEEGNAITGKEKKGVPLSDVWNIPFLNPKAKERVGYPTQKPILLLERIIGIATDKGDWVLDPFCGSGSTLIAAKLFERNYIGMDISAEAVQLAEQRLLEPVRTESQLLTAGEESYLEKSDFERAILKSLDAIAVERNNGIDGFLKSYVNNRPVAVRIQKIGEDIEDAKNKLVAASKSKNCTLMILVRTHRQSNYLFAPENDENILVVDSYDLLIDEWLQNHKYAEMELIVEKENQWRRLTP